MSQRSFLPIVLAAGLGTRMRSNLPKVMHEIGHLPLVAHVLKMLSQCDPRGIAVVIGPDMSALNDLVTRVEPAADCFIQTDRLGTAHAALAARDAMNTDVDDVLVLFGDTPLVTPHAIRKVRAELAGGADVAVLGFEAADPFGYGRLLTDGGKLLAIREERDATDEERTVTFCNSGIMGFSGKIVLTVLDSIENHNAKGEFYLTDAAEIANRLGLRVVTASADEEEVQGINTRAQLAACEAVFQKRMRSAALENGVSLLAPDTVYFAHDTLIETGAVIEQNVVFGPGVKVEGGATIRAFSHLENAFVGAGATVGPYARLRPGATISSHAHVGNFVEIKNAEIGSGAKVNHLTYIGDAFVGAKTNIGAGTITCNYDGFGKHRTEIGAGSFVGSNATLVAPLTLGDGVYVAAGSTVTEDVPTDALVIGRGRQALKPGRAEQLRARFKAAKEAKNK